MIKAVETSADPPVLRVGDEPADLALGRILVETRSVGDVVFPEKGETGRPTTLGAESAEWLIRRRRDILPPSRAWLFDLAKPEDRDATDGPSGKALREISVLLASARRSAAHDLVYALGALAGAPEDVRRDPRLIAFREECARATRPALAARPVFAWRVALVSFRSAEGVEDIVAARWRDKLSRYLVLAANETYAAGKVTYAFRAPKGLDGAGILLSALPDGSQPPRVARAGAAGRGSLDTEAFRKMLSRLKFRATA